MSHLTLEALARLVDEAPTPEEHGHLAECGVCREELAALRDQTESLAGMPKLTPPPDLWPELRSRLREEGLVAAGRLGNGRIAVLTRIAAALVLFLAGSATGWAARGPAAPATPPTAASSQAETPALAMEPAPSGQTPAGISGEVERAQEVFAAALDRYMQANSTEAPDPAARLAALDNIVLTTAEALNESPADPVINSYHLTAVAQRNELLRQIAASDEPVF